MPDEVAENVYRLAIPMPDNPLGTVNAYAVIGDGVHLVDCGWNTPEAYEALAAELRELGWSVQDIRDILVTHIHPDHFGLAERLSEESGGRELMHRLDAVYVAARYEDTSELVVEMDAWLRINGVPPDELEVMTAASLRMLSRVGTRPPDVLLEGGEGLDWGGRRFEVVWTPGHSSGLVCLYDRERRILFSSDHVLQRISPHVGLHTQSLGNPLGNYFNSLELVRRLEVDLVLPGHGAPFTELSRRIDEIEEHHEQRSQEILRVLEDGEATAYGIAARLSWRGAENGWEQLEPFQRRMAVTETLAHLEYLYGRDRVEKRFEGGLVCYGPQH